jgi:anaerobic magnesium-protoporphyrin IX monomethyl ester cyclase
MFHLISLNCRYSHSCLAQLHLRQALETHLPAIPTLLTQLTINDPYYPSLLRLSTQPAQALLFSVYIWNHAFIHRLVQDLACLIPKVPLVLGGPEAPALPDLPKQCTVFVGEIEGAGKNFFHDLALGTLKPLYTAQTSSDFSSPYRPEDFNSLLKNRQVYYESSRGCPFRCSYCLSSISKGVRHKELDRVQEELHVLLAARPRIIKLVDRTFNDQAERVLHLWDCILKQGTEVKFHFEMAPDRFTEAMFHKLAHIPSGLFQFEMGIQSCNPQSLAAVQRQMHLVQAEENIRRLVALNRVHIHVDLILGLPFETHESFLHGFNRIFACGPHHIQLGLLKVLPDTALRSQAEDFGLVFCKEAPYEVLATRWLKHTELHQLYQLCECIEAFYNTRFFPSLWMYLRQSPETPSDFFQDLLELCRQQGFFERAHTQAFMTELLAHLSRQRGNMLLLELLCYDWLRCGHRFTPDCLGAEAQSALRDRLRRDLTQSKAGLFSSRSRTEFLKQATFLELSSATANVLGWETGEETTLLAFLPEQEGGIMPLNRVVVLA